MWGPEHIICLLLKKFMIGDNFRQETSNKKQVTSGFTLVEMLVAMSIFVITATAATDLFISASRMSKAVRARERLQNEARFAFETLAREIRTGTIDYAAYGGSIPAIYSGTLNLRDRDNNAETFSASQSAGQCSEGGYPCLLLCDNAGSCSSLTTEKIVWEDLKFYVSPLVDPFTFNPVLGGFASSEQPRVTVFAKLRIVSALPEEAASITLQTTVTSRVYKR